MKANALLTMEKTTHYDGAIYFDRMQMIKDRSSVFEQFCGGQAVYQYNALDFLYSLYHTFRVATRSRVDLARPNCRILKVIDVSEDYRRCCVEPIRKFWRSNVF
jgi:hypothetical protein